MVNNIQVMPLSPSDRQNNIQIEGAFHFRTLLCIFSCQYSHPLLIFLTALFGARISWLQFQLPVTAQNISTYGISFLFLFNAAGKTFPSQLKVLRCKHSLLKDEREKKKRGTGQEPLFFLLYGIIHCCFSLYPMHSKLSLSLASAFS